MKRPKWCPHPDCIFVLQMQNNICGGILPHLELHGNDFNNKRFCIDTRETGHGIMDLQVNNSDLWWFELLFKKLKRA